MPPQEADLPTAELEVLKTLWDGGPATVRQVMNRLHRRGRKVAYTTVLTFLTRLEQRGFVKSDKSGLAYIYRPKVTREKVSKSRLRSLLEELYDGAAAPLVLQLVRDEKLDPEDIDELQRLINTLDLKPRRSKKKKAGRSRS
ncbi:MAG: BlaI/MecI/CopY family transcriptional regulator [Phycisphaerales bacterium]|nr:MAG: BlaI/MecI/CopY family transcriptional regulator [Phycisphaerales bacterium]